MRRVSVHIWISQVVDLQRAGSRREQAGRGGGAQAVSMRAPGARVLGHPGRAPEPTSWGQAGVAPP